MAVVLRHLLAPIELGNLSLRNRTMMTTHGPRLSQRRYLRYLEERSRDIALVGLPAGFGLGPIPPGPGRVTPGYLPDADAYLPHPLSTEGRAYYDRFIVSMSEQAAVVHANGARCVGQLHHGGIAQSGGGHQPVVGPSSVVDDFRRRVPHVLSTTEIADIVEAFGEAARRVHAAGLDGVEIHGAHGYLVNQFLSPFTNTRTDEYGGSPERRLRFLLEVLGAVRSRIGPEVPIGVRLPGAELVDGGLRVTDVAEIGRQLADWGVAYLNISSGNYAGLGATPGLAYVAPGYVAPGPSVEQAATIRTAVDIPVIVAGRLTDLALADRIIADGKADLIGFTRALIADPRLVAKARGGLAESITTCIACNECHTGETVACVVNPSAGREEELELHPADRPKRLVVVGGGPAGMQLAAVAAGRGHHVTLIEAQPHLGGALAVLSEDPNRPQLAVFLEQLRRGVDDAGVIVELETEATPALVAGLAPDAVVLATGAAEARPAVPGVDDARVLTGLEVLPALAHLGDHVVVVGGTEDHLPPMTIADLIAGSGRRVTLLSELIAPGEAVEAATRYLLLRRLLAGSVEVRALTRLQWVRPGELGAANVLTGAQEIITEVDHVVLVGGRRPRRDLVASFEEAFADVQTIGDCLTPGRLVHATLDATRVAVAL